MEVDLLQTPYTSDRIELLLACPILKLELKLCICRKDPVLFYVDTMHEALFLIILRAYYK